MVLREDPISGGICMQDLLSGCHNQKPQVPCYIVSYYNHISTVIIMKSPVSIIEYII